MLRKDTLPLTKRHLERFPGQNSAIINIFLFYLDKM